MIGLIILQFISHSVARRTNVSNFKWDLWTLRQSDNWRNSLNVFKFLLVLVIIMERECSSTGLKIMKKPTKFLCDFDLIPDWFKLKEIKDMKSSQEAFIRKGFWKVFFEIKILVFTILSLHLFMLNL